MEDTRAIVIRIPIRQIITWSARQIKWKRMLKLSDGLGQCESGGRVFWRKGEFNRSGDIEEISERTPV